MHHKRAASEPTVPSGSGEYRQAIRQADEILSEKRVDIHPDNWPQLALDWFAPHEPDRSALERYIVTYRNQIGSAWAREILRMQVLIDVQDYECIVEHYDRALHSYPRCALIELWVAGCILRTRGHFWRVREMYWRAAADLPSFAKPHYELGFISYLLGDFPGALEQFNRAAALVAAHETELGALIWYNRGMVRLALEGDKLAAQADLEEALRRKPDYAKAIEALRALKGRPRWIPW